MANNYKIRLNSSEKIEELLQEIYDQACRQLNETQNQINLLTSSTNLGSDDVTMDEKAKYAKAIHDFMGDKSKAIAAKFEIAKFMGELIKHHGDVNATINDKDFKKRTSLNLEELKAGIAKSKSGDTNNYDIKKN